MKPKIRGPVAVNPGPDPADYEPSGKAIYPNGLGVAWTKHGEDPPSDSLVRRHIDDYIDDYRANAYARFVFNHFRLPAEHMMAFRQWMSQFRLFCTYQGERFRVTGASRLGDVWLTRDFERMDGYEVRGVCVDDCTDWGREP